MDDLIALMGEDVTFFSDNIKTRLGGEDFTEIQEEYSAYRACLLEILRNEKSTKRQ